MPDDTWATTDTRGATTKPTDELESSQSWKVPALTICCHVDLSRVGEQLYLPGLLEQEVVEISRTSPGFHHPDHVQRRPIEDRYVSRTSTILRGLGGAGFELSRNPRGPEVVVDGERLDNSIQLTPHQVDEGVFIELARRVSLLLSNKAMTRPPIDDDLGLVGDSDAIHSLRERIRNVAGFDVPVLIRGETGCGKELVSQAIHALSARRDRECLCVNMGAIPPNLAASELFGHVKGAFSGAETTRDGYFMRADGGTLMLDEIGDAPADVQVMLFRALENGEIQQIGAHAPVKVDVRLMAATDVDLEEAVAKGRFRGPLLYRLAGFEIAIEPLRARREDIPRLLVHFLEQEMRELGRTSQLEASRDAGRLWLAPSLVSRLARLHWPGNVRQLRNMARQLVITSLSQRAIHVDETVERLISAAVAPIPGSSDEPTTAASAPGPSKRPPQVAPRSRKPSEISEEELQRTLAANSFKLGPTAATLGIARNTLNTLIDRFPSIRRPRDLGRPEIQKALRAHGDVATAATVLGVSKRGLQLRMTELGIR